MLKSPEEFSREVEPINQAWDAAKIKQPDWGHVEGAFLAGAREARANPDATDEDFRRAADGHTKAVFEEVDPVSEAALRTESWIEPDAVTKAALEVAFCWDNYRWTKETSDAIEVLCAALASDASPQAQVERKPTLSQSDVFFLIGIAHAYQTDGRHDNPWALMDLAARIGESIDSPDIARRCIELRDEIPTASTASDEGSV